VNAHRPAADTPSAPGPFPRPARSGDEKEDPIDREPRVCRCSVQPALTAAQLARELERLMPREARYVRGLRIGGPADAAALLVRVLAPLEVEEFHILLLDARHMLKRHEMLARGSLAGVDVHPREVFAPAIRYRAAAILCAHNHPSGDATPSRQDIELTRRLVEVGELVAIPVVDHIVIGTDGRYQSFSELGLIKPAPKP